MCIRDSSLPCSPPCCSVPGAVVPPSPLGYPSPSGPPRPQQLADGHAIVAEPAGGGALPQSKTHFVGAGGERPATCPSRAPSTPRASMACSGSSPFGKLDAFCYAKRDGRAYLVLQRARDRPRT
eukprot:12075523-Alexandrium_andersonii.AAC.1